MEEEIKNIEDNYASEESKKNSRILWWAVGIFLFFILLFGGLLSYLIIAQKSLNRNPADSNQNTSSNLGSQSEETAPIDTSLDPVQQDLMEANMITLQGSKGEIFLSPMATYSISAKVMSATNYSGDWQAEFEPTDLALAWGDLAKPGYEVGITYTQSGRWYYYHYDATAKADGQYIGEHSANTHIIPASDTIKNAVKKIKEGQNVKIDGYLVDVRYLTSEGEFTQTSSLSRADTGDGACEVVYVDKIQIDDKVYQ